MRFVFPPGVTAQGLVQKLAQHQWRSQVCGPHGSGKTTLLWNLRPCWETQRQTAWYTVAPFDAQSQFDWARESHTWNSQTLVVVDGFDQLRVWRRLWLVWMARSRSTGLLVTSHRPWWGLPVLWQLRPDYETFLFVVRQALASVQSPLTFSDAQLQAVWHAGGGNLREALFAMYDLFEQANRVAPTNKEHRPR